MSIRCLLFLCLTLMAVSVAPRVRAEVAPVVVPTPDVSKLPPASAEEVRKARADFERSNALLSGGALAENYAVLGETYAQYGFYDAATVAFEDAARIDPKDGRWIYAQGLIARLQRQPAVAQNLFNMAFQLTPSYLPIRVAVAQGKVANGDFAGARTLLEQYVATNADQAVPFAMLGTIALHQKRYADAAALFRRALTLDPKATQLYASLAAAEQGAGNAKAAADARAKVGPVAPTLPDPLSRRILSLAAANGPAAPVSDVTEAARALAKHAYPDARKSLDKALAEHPGDATVLALYSRVEAAAGYSAAAKSRAAAAIAADPKNALGYLSQGVSLEMSGDDAGAQRAYEQAIEHDPNLAEARRFLGNLLMRNGRYDAAVSQYRALVRLDVLKDESWTMLVAAYVMGGHCDAALRDVSDGLGKEAKNKFLLRLFVRLASTCPAASADQKRGALEYGARLYHGNPSPVIAETYALALAANGKWKDAIATQQAAIFLLVRNRAQALVPPYRQLLNLLQAHKVPDRPWPADAAIFHPARLAPDPKTPPPVKTAAPAKSTPRK